jgi:hypothetical protein
MRRLMGLVTVTVLAVCVIGGGAIAGPGKLRIYRGTLGDTGRKIFFHIVKRVDRPVALREIEFGVEMTCDVDGSIQQWGVGFGWGGRIPSMPSHTLGLDMVDFHAALHVHGKIQAVHGEGTLSFAIPEFTADATVQTCASGDLTWTVDRTVPSVEQPNNVPPIEVRHFVLDGAHVTLTRMS